MPTPPDGAVPCFGDPADYARARALLADADFTGRGITRRLAVATVPTAKVLNHPLYVWRTRGGDALDTFIRLFLLYAEVSAEAARAALRPMELETWVEAGLLRPADASANEVAATVRMLPYGDLVLVTDRPPRTEAEIRRDFVMSVGAATLTLANATVLGPVRRTLDLGCGCGTLGLLAAEHSGDVYCLDRNPRAVAYTRFNAAFNGLGNVRALEGNLFEPVADLAGAFDLVVCNPPFVISPESRYLYRDSGMRGDEICRTVARQVPAYLAERGLCQMLCNWAHVKGEDWREHLSSWFDGGGCDAWVLRYETRDVADYADEWVRGGQPGTFDEWMRYYEREGIDAVSLGLINLRRRAGRTNRVSIEDGTQPQTPAGEEIAAGFAARDYLEDAGNDALLATRFRTAAEARLEQQYSARDGAWQLTASTLHRVSATPHRGNADPYVTRLLAGCTGRRPLGELVNELADSLGRAPVDVAPAVLTVVRDLVLKGHLVPDRAVTSP